MKTLFDLAQLPVPELLVKWTMLLALGWGAHALLRSRHARWRVILWRGILCCGLVLPLTPWLPLPKVQIPIRDHAILAAPAIVTPGREAASIQIRKEQAVTAPVSSQTAMPAATTIHRCPAASASIPWSGMLATLWAMGALLGAMRLVRLTRQLSQVKRNAVPAGPAIDALAGGISRQWGTRRIARVLVSETAVSPFVFGVFKPVIMLPGKLANGLSPAETAALLAHELAHLRHHDLFWCVGWRWLSAVFWFHPLVWSIPAAHSLACEEEADRLASRQTGDSASYAPMLARLALRVLSLPAVETQLTANGTAQITQRLRRLGQEFGAWRRLHTVAALAMVAALVLASACCTLTGARDKDYEVTTSTEFKELVVYVQDEHGKPLQGAILDPDGFRVKGIHRVDAHGWIEKRFGPRTKVTTDQEGKASIRYPVMAFPEEKLQTGDITFSVIHPEYCTTRLQQFSVEGTDNPIKLVRGIGLQVTGHLGRDQQPVRDLVINISGESIRTSDWSKTDQGIYTAHRLSPGPTTFQLMGRLDSGEIVFSDAQTFTAEAGKKHAFDLEMYPGIRLEGRLDDRVARPVKNGRVIISVRPKQFPAWKTGNDGARIFEKTGSFHFWRTYRPIAEDGTFIVESMPAGELDVVVHGDGFVSRNGPRDADWDAKAQFALPQAYALSAPVTRIEVATEPTASLAVTARTRSGNPVEGAMVFVSPNILRMQGIFASLNRSSEEPYRHIQIPEIHYSGKTDASGKAFIPNLPPLVENVDIYHPEFQATLNDRRGLANRYVRVELSSGVTQEVAVTLQKKGRDFIGKGR